MKPQRSKMGKPISDLFLDFFREKLETGKEGKRQVHRFQRPGLEAKVDLRFNPSKAAGVFRVIQFAFENLMALDDFEDRPFIPVRSLLDIQIQSLDDPVRQGKSPPLIFCLPDGQAHIPKDFSIPPGKILAVNPREKEEGFLLSPLPAQNPVQNQIFVFAMINRAHPAEVGIPDLPVAKGIKPGYGFQLLRQRPRPGDLKGGKHEREGGEAKMQDSRSQREAPAKKSRR